VFGASFLAGYRQVTGVFEEFRPCGCVPTWSIEKRDSPVDAHCVASGHAVGTFVVRKG
jgi:hypothetical protein